METESRVMHSNAVAGPSAGYPPEARRRLVLGVGNLLLRDDGVGIHAVRKLSKSAPRGVLAVDAGTNPWSALHLLEQSDKVIVFDALVAGGRPGSIYVLDIGDVRREPVRGSLHEVDLVTVLETMKGMRPEVVVVAAEPGIIDCGMDLSPPVERAVPRMVEVALELVSYWRSRAPREVHTLGDLLPGVRAKRVLQVQR